MDLPHCQHAESLTPQQCVDQLDESSDEEIYLAVSNDFYNADDQLQYDTIYPEYEKRYRQLIADFSEVLGPPEHSTDWQADGYPDWAVGELVTIWNRNGSVLWLRLHHEDREVPILIALARQYT